MKTRQPSALSAPHAHTHTAPAAERLALVQRLRQQVAGVGSAEALAADDWVSSDCRALDRCLPQGTGFRRGSLVEWLVTGPANGAGTLALLIARQACLCGGTLVVLDPAGEFYPVAAAACGIDLRRLLIVRPQRTADELWAWYQALRSPAVKAVWGWQQAIDDRWFRRWQLAAEQSGCLGLLLRPAKYRVDPSWSAARLAVSGMSADAAGGRYLHVELVRDRGSAPASLPRAGPAAGGQGGVSLKLEARHGHLQVIELPEHETSALHLVSQLADPTLPGCSTRT